MSVRFGTIATHGPNADIAYGIRPFIVDTGHAILLRIRSTLLPFSTLLPDLPPLFKGQFPGHAPAFGVGTLGNKLSFRGLLIGFHILFVIGISQGFLLKKLLDPNSLPHFTPFVKKYLLYLLLFDSFSAILLGIGHNCVHTEEIL
jgi:hypothetical protein